MNYFQISQPARQVLADQPPVAVVRLGLTAEQTTVIEEIPIDRLFDAPLLQQGNKSFLVFLPGYPPIPVPL